MPPAVDAVRANGGFYTLNLAHADHVETVQVGPIEIYNPADAEDRSKLLAALVAAQEIATAVPSVTFYKADAPGSIHRLLARAIEQKLAGKGPQAAIYAAENNNHAAELLRKLYFRLDEAIPASVPSVACFANTVLIKMCGILPASDQLLPIALRCKIISSKSTTASRFPPSTSPKPKSRNARHHHFEEKPDLLPFEEAKLNALTAFTRWRHIGGRRLRRWRNCPKCRAARFSVAAGTQRWTGLIAKHGG